MKRLVLFLSLAASCGPILAHAAGQPDPVVKQVQPAAGAVFTTNPSAGSATITGSVVSGSYFNGANSTGPNVTVNNNLSTFDGTGSGVATNWGGTIYTDVSGKVPGNLKAGFFYLLNATTPATGSSFNGATNDGPSVVASSATTFKGANGSGPGVQVLNAPTVAQGTAAAVTAGWPTQPTGITDGGTTPLNISATKGLDSPAATATALVVSVANGVGVHPDSATLYGLFGGGATKVAADPSQAIGAFDGSGSNTARNINAFAGSNMTVASWATAGGVNWLSTASLGVLNSNRGTGSAAKFLMQSGSPYQSSGMTGTEAGTSTGSSGSAADVRSVGACNGGTATVFTIVTGSSGGVTMTIDSSNVGANTMQVCLEPASGAATDEIKFGFTSCADAGLNGWPVTHAVFDQAVGANAALVGPARVSNLNLKIGDKIYFVNATGTQPVHVWWTQVR